MAGKQVITAILFLFVGISVLYLLTGTQRKVERAISDSASLELDRSADAENAAAGEGFSSSAHAGISGPSVVVYYFHGTKRCPTCMKIESYTRESIIDGFPGLIESGRLRFLAINVDDAENEHFIDDYELTTKSVVLSDRANGKETRWKNLNLVWEYVGEKDTFVDYIRRETSAYLGGLENE
jgi:hypothetical protein